MSKPLPLIRPLGAGVTHSLDTAEPRDKCADYDLGLHFSSTIYCCWMIPGKLLNLSKPLFSKL